MRLDDYFTRHNLPQAYTEKYNMAAVPSDCSCSDMGSFHGKYRLVAGLCTSMRLRSSNGVDIYNSESFKNEIRRVRALSDNRRNIRDAAVYMCIN